MQKKSYENKNTITFLNKSNTECGIICPTNAFMWDHIHYLEVSYQYSVKVTMLIFKLLWRPSWF